VENETPAGLGRRNLMTGLAAAGVGIPLLAACGASAPSVNPLVERQRDGTLSSDPVPLTKAADVPVGGGVILADAVVTQPSEGVFKAFTPICTHQGCAVTSVSNQQIHCPCHGSSFSIADGSVQVGPAVAPLTEILVSVKKGEVVAE